MSTIPIFADEDWRLPSRGRVGMFSLIIGESAIFTIFVVAYVSWNNSVTTVAFSVAPSRMPSTCLRPSASTPTAPTRFYGIRLNRRSTFNYGWDILRWSVL
jgi:heme/copper-type cytochrome/quinol oxidase subunit 3